MQKLPKISVIVPVYKVEPYLDHCIQSIVNQTYKNLEIILVDDGSPDGCPQICDEWAERDSRIMVLHKENGGLSDARNAGMKVATGELMGFIDSDDWIESDMYELLYQHLHNDDADISACGVEMVWEDETPSKPLTAAGTYVLTKEEAMKAIVEESWLKQPVWYKLYKTDLIRQIPFAVGKCHEDVFWSYQVIAAANKITVFDKLCYHYLQRAGSIMGASFSMKRMDSLIAKSERQIFIESYFPTISAISLVCFYFDSMYLGQLALRSASSDVISEVFTVLFNIIKRHPIFMSGIKSQSFSHKCWLIMFSCFPMSTCRLRNLLKIGM